MKKRLKYLTYRGLIFAFLVLCMIGIAHIPTKTKVGVNFIVHQETLPLYQKTLHFLSRHFETKKLALKIVGDETSSPKKIQLIFQWVTSNIHPTPKNFTIIDDHPLNILIRQYGEPDQMNDIFSLLCTYTGIQSFFYDFSPLHSISLVFVKIDHHWHIFDIPRKKQFPLDQINLLDEKTYPKKNLYQAALKNFNPNNPAHLRRNLQQKPLERLVWKLKKIYPFGH